MKIDISLLLLLSITVCSIVVAADEQTNILGNLLNMMGGQDGGQCEFLCPKDGKKTRDPEHTPSSNGCGAHGVKIDVSRFAGFEQCCDTHDICYDTCSKVRKHCDDDFNKCLKRKCEQITHDAPFGKRDQIKEQCRQMNHILYSGASSMGCTAYQMAQSNACLCDGEKVDLKKSGQYAFDRKTLSKKSSEKKNDKLSVEDSKKSSAEESEKSSAKESDKSSLKESDKSSKKESDKSSKKESDKSSKKESDESPKKESKKRAKGKRSSRNEKIHQAEKEEKEQMEKLKAIKQQEWKELEESIKDEEWLKKFEKHMEEFEEEDKHEMSRKHERKSREQKTTKKEQKHKTTKTSEKKDSDKIKEKEETEKETVIESRTLPPREEL